MNNIINFIVTDETIIILVKTVILTIKFYLAKHSSIEGLSYLIIIIGHNDRCFAGNTILLFLY